MSTLFSLSAVAQEKPSARLVVEARYDQSLLETVSLNVKCSTGRIGLSTQQLTAYSPIEIQLEDFRPGRTSCQLLTRLPEGYSVVYSVLGETIARADKDGCQYARINDGDVNHCLLEVSQDPVTLTVYKKWVGGSGEEADVKIQLSCESGAYSGDRFVNEGAPGSWQIGQIDPEGILCNVSEEVRDNFRPDIIDCQGLYIRPGKGEECTMINTKIVKRIEMFNRYGKWVMIILVLGVGLIAVKRFSPVSV